MSDTIRLISIVMRFGLAFFFLQVGVFLLYGSVRSKDTMKKP